jgi:hypothetical protein
MMPSWSPSRRTEAGTVATRLQQPGRLGFAWEMASRAAYWLTLHLVQEGPVRGKPETALLFPGTCEADTDAGDT